MCTTTSTHSLAILDQFAPLLQLSDSLFELHRCQLIRASDLKLSIRCVIVDCCEPFHSWFLIMWQINWKPSEVTTLDVSQCICSESPLNASCIGWFFVHEELLPQSLEGTRVDHSIWLFQVSVLYER